VKYLTASPIPASKLDDQNRFNRLRALWQPGTLVIAVFVLLAARLLLYTRSFAVNLLFSDQWAVYSALFEEKGLLSAFRFQHGPHRQGLGGILIYLVAQLSGWDGRWDAYLVAVVLIISTILALLLKHRLTGRFDWLDAIIPILFLSLNQWETLTVVPNVSHSALPLLLVMVYAIALTVQRPTVQMTVLVVTNFLLLYTGFGIFAAFITLVLFLVRSVATERAGFDKATRWVWIIGLLLAVLSLASFFADWKLDTALDCTVFPHPRPFEYLIFAGLQAAQGFAIVPGADRLEPATITAMLIGLATILCAIAIALRSCASRQGAVITFLISFSLLFIASTAVGRVCLGAIQQPLSSRYSTLVLPMLLGIYLWACTHGPTWQTTIGVAAVILIVLSQTPPFFRDPYTGVAQGFHDDKTSWQSCYLATLDPFHCDEVTGFQVHPKTEWITGNLRYLEKHHLNLFKDAARDMEITGPPDGSKLAASPVELSGVIAPPGFEHYDVQWGKGEFPSSWNWLSGPHLGAVENGVITQWNVPDLQPGVYTVRVTAFLHDGSQRVAMVRLVK
jgi:hypothetical protein